jgi:hypothetical protein
MPRQTSVQEVKLGIEVKCLFATKTEWTSLIIEMVYAKPTTREGLSTSPTP